MQGNVLSTMRRGVGIQNYFKSIYQYMSGGLLVSALMAWLSVREPLWNWFYKVSADGMVTYSVLGWVSIFAPFFVLFFTQRAVSQLNVAQAKLWFWGFSALMGISLGNVFLLFAGSAISQAFLTTAAVFLGLSWFGYSTKRDVSQLGRFAMIGLIGVVLSSIVNIFIASEQFNFVLNLLAVVIFTALTIYDTNRLKTIYSDSDSAEIQEAKAIRGALMLYLDFINLFRLMLYFLNNRR